MDLKGSLKTLATFIERPINEIDLPALMNHLNIENFKQNSSVNMEHVSKIGTVKFEFVRRGQIGGNPEMTPQIIEKINAWTDEQLGDSDLVFPHQSKN